MPTLGWLVDDFARSAVLVVGCFALVSFCLYSPRVVCGGGSSVARWWSPFILTIIFDLSLSFPHPTFFVFFCVFVFCFFVFCFVLFFIVCCFGFVLFVVFFCFFFFCFFCVFGLFVGGVCFVLFCFVVVFVRFLFFCFVGLLLCEDHSWDSMVMESPSANAYTRRCGEYIRPIWRIHRTETIDKRRIRGDSPLRRGPQPECCTSTGIQGKRGW